MLQKTTTKTKKRRKKENPYRRYLRENWFKGSMLILLFFVLIKKDLSFQVNMNNKQNIAPQTVQATSDEATVNQKPKTEPVKLENKTDQMSVLSFLNLATTTETKPEPKKTKTSQKEDTGAKDANNFANISAILVKDFAKRYPISQKEVDERRATCESYVKRFSEVAIAEMKRYGIPASITLAQGLLESDAGTSRLAKSNDNHFGMKCFSKSCKKGHCANFSDDTHKDFFRKYNNAWESYRAHSELLQGSRYKHLKKLGTRNYTDWAKGLKKAGYATDKYYAEKLIKIIKEMNLSRFDGV